MLQHFNEKRYRGNECSLTYFKKLGKSLDTASQPGQRQRPLTNNVLVPAAILEGTENVLLSVSIIYQ